LFFEERRSREFSVIAGSVFRGSTATGSESGLHFVRREPGAKTRTAANGLCRKRAFRSDGRWFRPYGVTRETTRTLLRISFLAALANWGERSALAPHMAQSSAV